MQTNTSIGAFALCSSTLYCEIAVNLLFLLCCLSIRAGLFLIKQISNTKALLRRPGRSALGRTDHAIAGNCQRHVHAALPAAAQRDAAVLRSPLRGDATGSALRPDSDGAGRHATVRTLQKVAAERGVCRCAAPATTGL